MKDGIYQMSLTAYAYSGSGRLALNGDHGRAEDDNFTLTVRLMHGGHALRGDVRVLRRASAHDHGGLPSTFSLDMLGSGGLDTFNLIGTGPRGIIFEIDAGWIGDA